VIANSWSLTYGAADSCHATDPSQPIVRPPNALARGLHELEVDVIFNRPVPAEARPRDRIVRLSIGVEDVENWARTSSKPLTSTADRAPALTAYRLMRRRTG